MNVRRGWIGLLTFFAGLVVAGTVNILAGVTWVWFVGMGFELVGLMILFTSVPR